MFSSRINRTSFIIGIAWLLPLLLLYFFFLITQLDTIFHIVFILPILIFIRLVVGRLHDLGLSGWACLLVLFPPVAPFILLMLITFPSKNQNKPFDRPQAPPDLPVVSDTQSTTVTGNNNYASRGFREYVAIALLATTGLMVLFFVAMVAIGAGLDEHSPSAEELNAFGMVYLNFVLLLTIGDVIWGIYGLKEAGANTNSRYHLALMTVGLIVLMIDLIMHI
ncbi:DUF805 domain-containing protein [Candidatus Saccharibacteria bacterium]|nr:DUF805 domain-containing protein [Candidatus Saccharibacteria bacterium]